MPEFSTAEIARDLASLWQALPESASAASIALQRVHALLDQPAPDLAAAMTLAAQALDGPDDDDAEERALLAVVRRLLAAEVWLPHRGDAAPVADRAVVLAYFGEGEPLLERAAAVDWGPGCGPAGEGRVQTYRVLT